MISTEVPPKPLSDGEHQKRLQVLYVVLHIPYVPSTGGMTRVFHLVRSATDVADVTLLGVAENLTTARLGMMRPLCKDIRLIPAPRSKPRRSFSGPLAQIAELVRAFQRVDPYIADRYDISTIRKTVRDLLRKGHYDLIVVDSNELGGILEDVVQVWNGPSIVHVHNVLSVLERYEYSRRRRQFMTNTSTNSVRPTLHQIPRRIKRQLILLSSWRVVRHLQKVEQSILATYSRVVAVSYTDAHYLQKLCPHKQVDVLPNGVDTAYFGAVSAKTFTVDDEMRRETIIFTGTLGYYPNIDAVRYFMSEIWPLIRARRPHTRFLIVGASPTPEILALGKHDGVEVHADVPDVRPYLAQSALAIVPLRLGSGTRLKILEALAAGRAVVSTTLGAEGLELEPGRDLVVADAPEAFAGAVVRLLEQPEEAERLARQGQQTVCERYSWSTIAQQFQSMIAQTQSLPVQGKY